MKSLCISDSRFAKELLSLPAPLSFIDFETFTNKPAIIPGTRSDDVITCQWSNHILKKGGLDNIEKKLSHEEFLWEGDWGDPPIYAFVESLYNSTKNSKTILIYSPYEITCLKLCCQIATNHMNAYKRGEIGQDYWVTNSVGRKVPLMTIAPKIEPWCNSMIIKMYDLCNGWSHNGGVTYYIQSPDLNNSNSIKQVYPVCKDEYSESEKLLAMFNIPFEGYEGLKKSGNIAKGDECQKLYVSALNRPLRKGYSIEDEGHAPFDQKIAAQCLKYCCLDTLSMVLIYLAVLESTKRWEDCSKGLFAGYAKFPDDRLYHLSNCDGDNQKGSKICSPNQTYETSKIKLVSERDFKNMNIREFYTSICPKCRKMTI